MLGITLYTSSIKMVLLTENLQVHSKIIAKILLRNLEYIHSIDKKFTLLKDLNLNISLQIYTSYQFFVVFVNLMKTMTLPLILNVDKMDLHF